MTTGSQPAPAPISDDEFLFRRIPKSTGWYKPGQSPPVNMLAFNPTDDDKTGLSLERAKSDQHPEFMSVAEMVAQGRSPKGYVVAVLSMRTLRENGIRVVPRTECAGPGHVELPDLNAANRKSDQAMAMKRALSLAVIRVEDPTLAADMDVDHDSGT
jgi:hypothetical protein